MVNMNSPSGSSGEKFVRLLIPLAIGAGVFWFWGSISNFVVNALKNLYLTLAMGIPLTFALLYVLGNPTVVWMGYRKLCRTITSAFVKLDPLSIMKGYLELLRKKKAYLDKTRLGLEGRQVNLQRKIASLNADMDDNYKKGQAALKNKNDKQAQLYGNFVAGSQESLKTYIPLLDMLKKKLTFLDDLSENWDYSQQVLAKTIERKEEEYKILRDTVRALKQAREFAQATDATRLYEESVKALEEDVSNKFAFIDDFEKISKTAMDNINLEKSMRAEQGMAALQGLDSKLMLDFSGFTNKLPSEELKYEPIKSTSTAPSLVKKKPKILD